MLLSKKFCTNSFCILWDFEATNGCNSATINVDECPFRMLFARINSKIKSNPKMAKKVWTTELQTFRNEFKYRFREDDDV